MVSSTLASLPGRVGGGKWPGLYMCSCSWDIPIKLHIHVDDIWTALNYIQCTIHNKLLPYSGKFSLVQIFAEKRPDSSEEIFAVFIFADAGHSGHTPTS